MKILLFLTGLTLTTSQLPPDSAKAWADLVSKYKTECLCATKADPAVVERWLYKYSFPNDACLKCFIKCVTEKLGLLNYDGSVNVDANLALDSVIPKMSANMTYSCTNKTANVSDICEKAFQYSFCIQTAIKNA
ncbi:hypothetical protein FQR65_LT01926 [Abscondita terminalis]|nr:hypothetical protein FQR65_LT01926 [Abscondita terminalis]